VLIELEGILKISVLHRTNKNDYSANNKVAIIVGITVLDICGIYVFVFTKVIHLNIILSMGAYGIFIVTE